MTRRRPADDFIAKLNGIGQRTCPTCLQPFTITRGRGRLPVFCSNACKQKWYRETKKEEKGE